MTKPPILLFAAGFGTRMGALTADKPKPLVQVAGRALIDHALALTADQDIGPKVVNIHYKGQMLRDHFAGTNVLFSDETDEILETGGGLRKAMPLLGGSPVITLNTDAIWHGPNPIAALLDAWHPDMEALLMTVPVAQAHGHKNSGDFLIDERGELTRGAGEIYSGLQMLRTDDLVNIAGTAFSLRSLWDRITKRGGMNRVSYTGQWCDVGRPESIEIAEKMIGHRNV